MRNIFGLLFLFCSSFLFGQAPAIAEKYASTIESETIKEHVYKLASPEFQGRETGTPGNLLAAQYISDQFKSYNIPVIPNDNNYFQEVGFTTIKWSEIQMMVNGQKAEHLKDFLSIPQYFPLKDETMTINSLTFLGYGIDDPAYSDYNGRNFTGQHLLVYSGEPRDRNGNSRITGSDSLSAWSTELFLKTNAAIKAGAASIFFIDDKLRDDILFARNYLLTGAMLMGSPEQLTKNYIAHAMISPVLAEKMVGKKRAKVIKLRNRISSKGKSGSLVIPVDIDWTSKHKVTSTEGVNVLGYIEGVDPAIKDEVVVVSAHYDHLGMRGNSIYFGADDNASGTSAVLEIAQAMALAKADGIGPARSVLCILVTGEEKGLLGSQYYAEHPVFSLNNTVADINIDMIGRADTLHKQTNYTYVIGSDRLSTELHEINETVNRLYTKLDLDYTYNRDDDPNRFYYRSDHYNFAKKGIPSIFYFSGVHEDYHRPTDTPDKLMYEKAETIAQLAFHTAWELANRKDRIKVNVVGRN
ncbi:MAG TPA: M28 family peptidase [Saprospiraceae bacterium]|nr:M28 family peptidase [Saprospiraceae bacterium]